MSWSFWVIFGMGLLAFEVVTPGGFFTLFFGVAALVVSLLVSLGILSSGAAQWLVFAVLGTGLILALRPMVRRRFETDTPKVDQIVSQTAIALENFDENGRGKVELRGTSWSGIFSGQGSAVVKGDRLRVIKIDGLSLLVEKE